MVAHNDGHHYDDDEGFSSAVTRKRKKKASMCHDYFVYLRVFFGVSCVCV